MLALCVFLIISDFVHYLFNKSMKNCSGICSNFAGEKQMGISPQSHMQGMHLGSAAQSRQDQKVQLSFGFVFLSI